MSFNFARQNEIGKKGEEILVANYHMQPLQKLEGKSKIGDFMRTDGKIIEIKSDTYPLARTPNFFMEYYSNLAKQTPGGPWRTFLNGADIFLYLYLSDMVYYECDDVHKLVWTLDDLVAKQKLKPQRIVNTTWITTGYKIPRESVSSLFTERRIDITKLSREPAK